MEIQFEQRLFAVAKYHNARLGVVAEEILRFGGGVQRETFSVVIVLVGIVECECPHFVGVELLDAENVVLEVCGEVESIQVIIAVAGNDQYTVVALELAQVRTLSVVVDAQDVRVEPHLASAQRGRPFRAQRDGLDLVLGEHISPGIAALNRQFGEVHGEIVLLEVRSGFELHAHFFRLSIGVGGEIYHLRVRFALSEVVLLVASHGCDKKAFPVVGPAFFAIAIYGVVDSALVVLLENSDMDDVGADKRLVRHLDNLVLAVLVEDDYIVQVGAVEQELFFFQAGADKALGAVDVQFLVRLDHRLHIDSGEVAHLGLAGVGGSVLVFEH